MDSHMVPSTAYRDNYATLYVTVIIGHHTGLRSAQATAPEKVKQYCLCLLQLVDFQKTTSDRSTS